MSRLSLLERYHMLFSQCTAPKSCDGGRATVYRFEKYCKSCGEGLRQPGKWTSKAVKLRYRHSYCGEECQSNGPRAAATVTLGPGTPPRRSPPADTALDDLVAVAQELRRVNDRLPAFVALVRQVDAEHTFLSEKLARLEQLTGKSWSKSKFYYWLDRAAGM